MTDRQKIKQYITSLIMPNSVKSLGQYAFANCTSLNSVTFQGTIPSSSFDNAAFYGGDLREKFYATNASNGTPGTYTRTSGGETWTRQ
jgi:hypothetical protein